MPLPETDRMLMETASPNPAVWQSVQHILSLTPANPARILPGFYRQVDGSPYSLSDWLSALSAFDDWLRAHDITARPFEAMVGYIHCVTLTFAETLSPPNLAEALTRTLDEHGFEAVEPEG